ncbi:bifunctional 4-hydroxy-2-oxoglutarate aldolase/2-dehydro-3-deoxy-phosphogluconate aldolase [Nonomuraea indica]|uniref:2-dehydro-3-deoxy-phosphogluconate aldolase n=1 Tax=Nonomuraea indica TaxID=1581193 RepID=A0ABW8AB05_9ACTN
MTDVSTHLARRGVVPVVAIDRVDDAPALGEALLAGGMPVAEITFRTGAAAGAIRALRRVTPDVLVGAGTVLDVATVDVAHEVGAQFVVTPGTNPAVVERCLSLGLPVVPGVNSPTGVEQVRALGLRLMKFFPAVPSGGIPMICALHGPYPDVRFMPTGGVTAETLPDWLAEPNVTAVGGTWIAPARLLAERRFDEIARRAAEAVQSASSGHRTPSLSTEENHD